MIPAKQDLAELHELEDPIEIRVVDGAKMEAIKKRTVIFRYKIGIMVKGVSHIPTLDRGLLSDPMKAHHGLDMRFGANHCDICKGN